MSARDLIRRLDAAYEHCRGANRSGSHAEPFWLAASQTSSFTMRSAMRATCRRLGLMGLTAATLSITAGAQEGSIGPKCKPVHADLVENRMTVGCKPEHPSCFLGEVDGNHGLRGTTYFRADSSAPGPSTSPGFIIYSGQFEYTTERGKLIMRETGASNQTQGNPESGAVTAFQKVIDATGEFSGLTGHFFVSGFSRSGHVETQITGQLCSP